MRYLGLLENVRVRRAGFAHRETYKRFESRYKMVSAATWPRGTGDARASTQTILAELQISSKPTYSLPCRASTYYLLSEAWPKPKLKPKPKPKTSTNLT